MSYYTRVGSGLPRLGWIWQCWLSQSSSSSSREKLANEVSALAAVACGQLLVSFWPTQLVRPVNLYDDKLPLDAVGGVGICNKKREGRVKHVQYQHGQPNSSLTLVANSISKSQNRPDSSTWQPHRLSLPLLDMTREKRGGRNSEEGSMCMYEEQSPRHWQRTSFGDWCGMIVHFRVTLRRTDCLWWHGTMQWESKRGGL